MSPDDYARKEPYDIPQDDTQTTGNRPANTLRDRGLKATIWRNRGESGPFYTAEFSRSFRNAAGDWCDSTSFGAEGLLKLSLLAQQTYLRIRELEQADRDAETSPDRSPK